MHVATDHVETGRAQPLWKRPAQPLVVDEVSGNVLDAALERILWAEGDRTCDLVAIENHHEAPRPENPEGL